MRTRFWLFLGLVSGLAAACAGGPWEGLGSESLRVSEVAHQGDPARRASQRLVLQGLDADASGNFRRAQAEYERALQVDATNPFAYLAMARSHAQGVDPSRSLPLLDQADALFEAQGYSSPRVEAHLIGLRGQVFYAMGRVGEALPYLDRARRLSPQAWNDGTLDADELR